MSASIAIIPWPTYSDSGTGPFWSVRIDSEKFHGTLTWSSSLGRFRKSNHLFRLRRGQPRIFQEVVAMMRAFCSKLQQQERDISATDPGHPRDINQPIRDISTGHVRGHSRARAEPSADVPDVPRGHISGDRDISQGHSSPDGIALRRPAVTRQENPRGPA